VALLLLVVVVIVVIVVVLVLLVLPPLPARLPEETGGMRSVASPVVGSTD
jgi:hypothetical protein